MCPHAHGEKNVKGFVLFKGKLVKVIGS